MDPLSITAACVGLLSGLTTVSTKLRSLTIDAKNTNKEVLALQNELDSFQRSLSVFYGSGLTDEYPSHLRSDLSTIIRQCESVVNDIDALLLKVQPAHSRQQLQWSFGIRDEVSRLHRNLEGHKSAITIAIAFATMSVNSGIKSDTSSIRSKAARIPGIENQLAMVLEAIHALHQGNTPEGHNLSLAMQRFLQEAYTESLSGTLGRSGSTTSYASKLYSTKDPFEDPKYVTEANNVARESGESGILYERSNEHVEIDQAQSDIVKQHEFDSEKIVLEKAQHAQTHDRSLWEKEVAVAQVETMEEPQHEVKSANNSNTKKKRSSLSLPFLSRRRSSQQSQTNVNLHLICETDTVDQDWLNTIRRMLVTELIALEHQHPDIKSLLENDLSACGQLALTNNDARTAAIFQQAVTLHEDGHLRAATDTLRDLAHRGNISGTIMYALSLRHGWGCERQETLAMAFLLSAAIYCIDTRHDDTEHINDEFRLALYEIANSKRHGWGVEIDGYGARLYYAAAVCLGDVDAMQELSWCHLNAFGGKRDKYAAARLLQRAEQKGTKVVGNNWIWKEKYATQTSDRKV